MRIWPVLVLLATLSACGGDGGGTPDSGRDFPDADLSNCLPDEARTEDCVVDVNGEVFDFVTGAHLEAAAPPNPPVPRPAYIRANTAFDGPVPFAGECPSLSEIPVPAATGLFAEGNLPCDSPVSSPVLVLTVDDPPGGSNFVASGMQMFDLTCAAGDCGSIDVVIRVPLASDVSAWRQTLDGDGVMLAFSRGLVLMQFLESDGTGAAGVTPTILDGASERPLVPGQEVRFFAADRLTLLGSTQTVTTASGVALVLLARPTGVEEGDSYAADLGGTRDLDIWTPKPAIFADGYAFMLEERLP
jgi:hypothetical protein